MTKRQCPFCHEIIDSSLHKCPHCDEELNVRCPNCGTYISNHVTICNYCGARLLATPIEHSVTWAVITMVLCLFSCSMSLSAIYCIYGLDFYDPRHLANSTDIEKLENIVGILFLFLLPMLSSIVAFRKKQWVALSIVSIVITFLITAITILLMIGG